MLMFKNIIKRLIKNPAKLICFLVLPFIFISLFADDDEYSNANIAVLDDDQTVLSDYVKEEMGKAFHIVDIEKDELDNYLLNGYIDYALIIEKGFEKDTLASKQVILKEQYIIESGKTYAIKAKIETVIQSINTLASGATNNNELLQRLEELNKGDMLVSKKLVETGDINKAIDVTGFFLQFMLVMAIVTTSIILEERGLNVLKRTLIAPITQQRYIIESFLSFLAIAFVQSLVFYLSIKVMGISVGNDMLFFLTLVLASVTNLCLGLFIVSFCKNEVQAYWIALCTTTPIAMVGGYYIPIERMPQFLQKISLFTPMRWIADTTTAIIEKELPSEFMVNYLVIVVFAFAFLLITLTTRKKFLRI